MNPTVGLLLAVLAVAAGWQAYGWNGVALAVTVIVFWLVLQFNRSIRVMKNAAHAPIGHVDSAPMLNAKLRRGMPLVQVLAITRSLGRRVGEDAGKGDDVYAWVDAGGSEVVVTFRDGRCTTWRLTRPG